MLKNLEWFWVNQIAPEMVGDTSQDISRKRPAAADNHLSSLLGVDQTPATSVPPMEVSSSALPSVCPPKRRKKGMTAQLGIPKIYCCGICLANIVEEPQTFKDTSVKCDHCPEWYHQICVNIVEGHELKEEDKWMCAKCELV